MQEFDLGIVGGGIMGASAALHASRRGAKVVLVEQASLPNPRGASVDHSKVFRYAYADPLYVRLAMEAHALWRELERDAHLSLLTPAGLLMLGHGSAEYEEATYVTLRAENCDAGRWSPAEAKVRFPQFAADAFTLTVFDPGAAIARAEVAVRATIDLARTAGVVVIPNDAVRAFRPGGLETQSGQRIACTRILVAAGPWTTRLVPELAPRLRVTRQEVLYFEPREPDNFAPERFPMFIDLGSGFYGFPVHHGRAMKIANHQKGPVADPDGIAPAIVDEPAARAFFARFLPELADARLVETRVCHYNNTPDDDFIIDWVPGRDDVLLATGFSGHGFKFGPVIGRICAEMLTSGTTEISLERFALKRFNV